MCHQRTAAIPTAVFAVLLVTGCRKEPELADHPPPKPTPADQATSANRERTPDTKTIDGQSAEQRLEASPTSQTEEIAGAVPTTSMSEATANIAAVSPEPEPQELDDDPARQTDLAGGKVPDDAAAPEPAAGTSEDRDTPTYRLLLPTTAGPLIVDVEIWIGDVSLQQAFKQRVIDVMDAAGGASDLTWPQLFAHVSSDPETFGRAQVNSTEYANVIQLFDRNHNKRPDQEEVTRFLFRNTRVIGEFRLVGSDYYRVINRSQSAVLSAIDLNDDRVLQPDEIDAADRSLGRLDHNGDQRIDAAEVLPTTRDVNNDPAWNARRSRRWGGVAMDISAFVDWEMLSYHLDAGDTAGVFGHSPGLGAKLDQDGDGSIDSGESSLILSIEPDLELSVRYPMGADQEPASIEIVSVADQLRDRVGCRSSSNQVTIEGERLKLIARVADRPLGRNQIPPEAFLALDANNDGGLEESEIPEQALRQYSFEDLDQNQDGKLTLREINEGLSPKTPIWSVQVRGRGAESPDAVFAWLDQNQDHLLSTREMNQVVDRLRGIASDDGVVKPTDIPDSFLVQFGRGDPDQDAQLFAIGQPTTGAEGSQGAPWPRWAQSMDTNRDGDISSREFPGTLEQFQQLDRNADGFIDSDEVVAGP